LTAVDDLKGSGVSGIAYETFGAQPMGGGCTRNDSGTDVMTLRLVIWMPGETRITFSARDHQGNQEELKTVTVFV
jgi:hypothetical protein